MESFGYGIDLGGTTVKIGFFSSERMLLEKWEIPTAKGRETLPCIAASVRAHMAARPVPSGALLGAALDIPGTVTGRRYTGVCVNIGWDERTDAGGILGGLLGVPVTCLNDANSAALGETWAGGGKGYENAVFITLGTGVGGGIIAGGRVVAGAHGAGGEIGHLCVEPCETVRCNCGRCGCLEQYSSATGVVRVAKKKLLEDPSPSGLREIPDFTARDVWALAAAGDPAASFAADECCRYLARGAAAAAVICDPDVFVIGGGMSKAGQPLLAGLQRYYRDSAFSVCRDADFRLASLGNDAGMYGCMRALLEACGRTV